MIKKVLVFLFLINLTLISAQEKLMYYSQFAGSNQNNHAITLPNFIRSATRHNAIAVIDGFTINTSQTIKISNINKVNLRFVKSIVQANSRVNGSLFEFKNVRNLKIDGLEVMMYTTPLPVYQLAEYPQLYNVALGIYNSSDIEIINSKFKNLYTRSIDIKNSSGNIYLSRNYFTSEPQKQKYLLEHIVLGSSPNAKIMIDNNQFDNTPYTNPDFGIAAISGFGLGKNGGSISIKDNYFNYNGRNNSGTHRLYTIDFYDDCDNIIVEDNIFDNVMWGAIRFNGSSENVLLNRNKISVVHPDETGAITSTTTAGLKNFKNIFITNNKIYSLKNLNTAIYLQNQFNHIVTGNISIANNEIHNSYVSVFLNGIFSEASINDNLIHGEFANQGINLTLRNSKVSNKITLSNNRISTDNYGIAINTTEPNYNPLVIQKNIIQSPKMGFYGIIINVGAKGNSVISDNFITNYKTSLYMRERNVKEFNNTTRGDQKKILQE